MNRFTKEKLLIHEMDTLTVKELKRECNKLIERYNALDEPLGEQGQGLTMQINDLMMVIDRMKDIHYQGRR